MLILIYFARNGFIRCGNCLRELQFHFVLTAQRTGNMEIKEELKNFKNCPITSHENVSSLNCENKCKELSIIHSNWYCITTEVCIVKVIQRDLHFPRRCATERARLC